MTVNSLLTCFVHLNVCRYSQQVSAGQGVLICRFKAASVCRK